MKRFFFSLIALSAAAIGCTQSALLETPDLFGTEIGFNPYTGRTPETKATPIVGATGAPVDKNGDAIGLSLEQAGGFNVLAFCTKGEQTSLYMNEFVDLVDSEWKYNGRIYWPDDNGQSTLGFAAYSSNVYGVDEKLGGGDDLITWINENQKFSYTVKPSINKQIDLLATNYQSGLTLSNNKSSDVNLKFNHLLSKIGFKLVANNENSDIDIVIKSVIYEGTFPQSGTVDLTSSAVAITPDNPDGTASYELLDIDNSDGVDGCFVMASSKEAKHIYVNAIMPQGDITEDSEFEAHSTAASNLSNRYMMIIPHDVTSETKDKITVVYQITDAAQRTAVINLPTDLKFEASKAYEFVLKVSTSTIGFEVEEYNWGDGANDNDPFPVIPDDDVVKVTNAQSTEANKAAVSVKVAKGNYETVKVQYRLKGTHTWTDGSIINYSNTTRDYDFSLSNLRANDDYEIHAIVTNSLGETEYSSTYAITTLPVVSTTSATNIVRSTANTIKVTAQLNGAFPSYSSSNTTGNGDAEAKLYFMYSDLESSLTKGAENITQSGDNFSSVIDGLEPNKTYYFKAFASNAGTGTGTNGAGGDLLHFTTPILTPTVRTCEIAEGTLEPRSATFKGTLDSDGGDTGTEAGFIYGISDNIAINSDGTLTSGTTKEPVTVDNGNMSFTATLKRFTTYYMRAYAKNSAGVSYGERISFKTPAEHPTLTVAVAEYDNASVTITGAIDDRGADLIDITCELVYGTAVDSKGIVITDNNQRKTLTPAADDKLSYKLESLASGQTYYFQVRVTNEGGESSSSPIMSFTTTTNNDQPIIDWENGNNGQPINPES